MILPTEHLIVLVHDVLERGFVRVLVNHYRYHVSEGVFSIPENHKQFSPGKIGTGIPRKFPSKLRKEFSIQTFTKKFWFLRLTKNVKEDFFDCEESSRTEQDIETVE
jgi:hypothetical protein